MLWRFDPSFRMAAPTALEPFLFDYFSPRERQIRKALKIIAGQRVTMIVQPRNILVIEKSPISTEWFEVAVQTCRIRGWSKFSTKAFLLPNFTLTRGNRSQDLHTGKRTTGSRKVAGTRFAVPMPW